MKGAASFDKYLIDQLKKNESFREAYLNEALNEEERGVSLGMFRNVAEAMGGVTKLSKASGLNRQNLYRALSGKRDPAFSTVEGIVHGFGFRIVVESMKKARKTIGGIKNLKTEKLRALRGKLYMEDNWEKLRAMEIRENRATYGKGK
jgi:probable addiction module antidote protein